MGKRLLSRAEVTGDERSDAWAGSEDDDHEVEIRQMFFRTRQGNNYRALYTVRGADVFVLHLRGPGQDLMGPDEITLP